MSFFILLTLSIFFCRIFHFIVSDEVYEERSYVFIFRSTFFISIFKVVIIISILESRKVIVPSIVLFTVILFIFHLTLVCEIS